MLRRRAINLGVSPTGAGAGRRVLWAFEDRVVWGGADALRTIVDVVRWPFERAAWAIESHLIWPLRERAGELSAPVRAAGTAAVAAAAIGAGVLGLTWAAGGGTSAGTKPASPGPPVLAQPVHEAVATAPPKLHGVAPDFTPEAGGGASKVSEGKALADRVATVDSGAAGSASASSAVSGAPAGPAALKVAHRFSGAFVLYETGQENAKVRATFAETATPRLSRSLLRRPPRLPANVEVPRAKVVNVVPGPPVGEDATVSVSLLRVGLTSELRLSMHRGKDGKWQVADVL